MHNSCVLHKIFVVHIEKLNTPTIPALFSRAADGLRWGLIGTLPGILRPRRASVAHALAAESRRSWWYFTASLSATRKCAQDHGKL